jgi:hypothetical protein
MQAGSLDPAAPGGSEEPPYKLTEKSPASGQAPENAGRVFRPGAPGGSEEPPYKLTQESLEMFSSTGGLPG